ncbi:MAG: 6,7-dimethyl-8-ribityllumazine synthase [Acidiferrobacteraceae bacterium]
MSSQLVSGDLRIDGARVGILAARFNGFIVERLREGALDVLRRHGVRDERIETVHVPGAFELPLAAVLLARSGRFDGLLALGAVIRGDTPHFDFVAGECVRGLGEVMREYRLPIGMGVLTVNTLDQAIARAGEEAGNKGEEAASALIEMVDLARRLQGAARPATAERAGSGSG